MSQIINRLCGRVYGWFDSKDARQLSKPLPASFRAGAKLALTNLEDRTTPSTFTVLFPFDDASNPSPSPILDGSDNGTGTLRQAMINANANPGPDIIVFSNSTAGGATDFTDGLSIIALLRPLPSTSVTVGEDLTITGPGADHLLMTRGTAGALASPVRPFSLGGSNNYTLSGMTLTGFSGSVAGGVIQLQFAGSSLVLDGMQITGNTSNLTGGAIDLVGASDVTIRNSTISYNYGSQGGALEIRGSGKSLTIENSTIAFNTGYNGAGAIQWGTGGSTATTITNTTITGNTTYNSEFNAGFGGGALQNHQSSGAAPMTLTLNSSIIAGNSAYNGRSDMSFGTDTTLVASYSVIGNADELNIFDPVGGTNKTGTQAAPVSANLGGFVRSAGGTLVLRPNVGSIAINNGDPAAPLAFDQRGLPRVAGSVDIGAIEIQSPATEPANSEPTLADVTTSGGTEYVFTVTYQRDGGIIDVATLGNATDGLDDVALTYPTGATVLPTFLSSVTSGTSVIATYTAAVPNGAWDPSAYGTYLVTLLPNAVKTTGGAPLAAGPLGSFNAYIGQTYTVSNTANTGAGSLRQAITDANLSATLGTLDTIVFDSSFDTAQTITVTSALPTIADSVNIIGPGSSKLTIQRSGNTGTYTILPISKTIGNAVVNISGMTLKGGTAGGSTGAPLITTSDEFVTLTDITISKNTVNNANGGQILVGSTTNTAGYLTLIDSTISDSRSTGSSGNNGGAILVRGGATITIQNSTIANNTANGTGGTVGNGGGIAFIAGTTTLPSNNLIITGSTISGNNSNSSVSTFGGGGILFIGAAGADGGLTIRNSTISGNSANLGTSEGGNGGGLLLRDFTGTANILNSTITGNTSTSADSFTDGIGGGGIALTTLNATFPTATINITSTILSGNVSSNGRDDMATAAGVVVNTSFSAIGDTDGFAYVPGTGDLSLANADIANLKLAPLAINGPGLTATLALQPGSTAVNAGSNPSPALLLDQAGNPRVNGAQIDIGSFERILGAPIATAGALPDVTVNDPTTNPYVFTISYAADSLMNRSTIGDGPEIVVTPPVGGPINATFVSADSAVNAQTITATYQIIPPGGTWDAVDNGDYSVGILANSVFDTDGNPVADNANLGTFNVAFATTFLVTNTSNDENDPNSLPGAIKAANLNAGLTDTIAFDTAGIFSTPQIITLGSEIFITDGLILNGPASKVTISGGNATRLFNINGPGSIEVSFSNFIFTEASATTRGGAVFSQNEVISFTDSVFTGNTTTNNGGAIGMAGGTGGMLTLLRTTLSNNRGGNGGAIDTGAGQSILFITDTTFSGNTSSAGGGAIGGGFPAMTILNSTFSGNSAAGTGGALQFANGSVGTGINITNSTISGNTATSGGGINVGNTNYSMQMTITNSTITGNLQSNASGNGGGIFFGSSNAGSNLTINSSIVAGNTLTNTAATATPDVRRNTAGNILGDNNLIGVGEATNATFTGTNPIVPGTKAMPLDPLLLPLTNNGGLTQTHLPTVASKAVNRGNNVGLLANDQRGTGFPRATPAGYPDIGAIEFTSATPYAQAGALPNVVDNQPGINNPYTFTVTYFDDVAVKLSTIGNQPDADVLVSRIGGGFSTFATFVSADQAADAPAIIATYMFTPPGGSWDASDVGTYEVTLPASAIQNTANVFNDAITLGTIQAQFATTFAVTNTADTGPGSLRQAILDANANAGFLDTIVFALPLFSTPQTINLFTGDLLITDSVAIQGTGANLLSINSNGSRSFDIVNNSSVLDVTLYGMKLSGANIPGTGNDGSGGAIRASSEIVTLDSLWITDNVADTGGGINMYIGGGTLNIFNSTFSGNFGTTHGGGVFIQCNTAVTTLNIRNSTFSGNSAFNLGGGVCLSNSNANTVLSVTNSTFANNIAQQGGGFRGNSAATVNIESTVFDGNVATVAGPSIATINVNSSFSALGVDGSYVPVSSVADIPNGTFLNLGTLEANGGPMPTHLPGVGSPLIDAGSNPASLAADQRGSLRSFNQTDIGSVEVQPTGVSNIVVNGNAVQRSRLTSIEVNFSNPIDAATLLAAGAITLTRTTGGPATVVQTGAIGANGLITVAPMSGLVSTLTLTFANADGSPITAGVEYGSLADGRWQLAIPSVGYTSALNSTNLRRLFGDINNDGTVDGSTDFAQFGAVFGTSPGVNMSAFDFNNDGTIDGSTDFAQFGARFGTTL